MKTTALVVVLSVCGGSTICAQGAVITLTAFLNGPQARPPNLAGGFGYANATVDDVTGAFTIAGSSTTLKPLVEVTIRGPNNPPSDELGPLILTLSSTSMPSSQGAGFDGSFSGSATFDSTQVAELIAGHDFVAVHTDQGPDLGGTLIVPEPMLVLPLLAGLLFLRPRQRCLREAPRG